MKKINFSSKEKVVLITPILAHYRKDLYSCLSNSNKFKFYFVGGDNYLNIKRITNLKGKTFSYISFSLLNHKFYFLKGSLKYIFKLQPQVIISSGVDFHLIHTLFIFLVYRLILRKRFYWWSQGTKGHQGKLGWFFRKIAYKLASGILLYNQEGMENLLHMGVKPKKLMVVGNCLNNEDYGYLNHDIFGRKDKLSLNLLYSGRVTRDKRLDILIKALGIVKERKKIGFRCTIVGDGDVNLIRELAKKHNVSDNINLVGAKYGKDVYSFFLNSDLFIYPGGIGLSIVHALSYGLPVITTDNLSLHFPEFELLVKVENGDLYKDGDASDLAEKIIEWNSKLNKSKEYYVNNCIKRIKDLGYLPEKVCSAVNQSLLNQRINKL